MIKVVWIILAIGAGFLVLLAVFCLVYDFVNVRFFKGNLLAKETLLKKIYDLVVTDFLKQIIKF
jgi:hypothetical protein